MELSLGRPLLWGVALDKDRVSLADLLECESRSYLKADVVVFYKQWVRPTAQGVPAFPSESLQAIWDYGAVPCLTWEPCFRNGDGWDVVDQMDVLQGVYDSYLRQFASKARQWGRSFMIRFAPNMNNYNYAKCVCQPDAGIQNTHIYRQVYKYIVEIFQEQQAQNVLWVFCPDTTVAPDQPWNRANSYYPGDHYIDILGMNGYNYGAGAGGRSPSQIFSELYQALLSLRSGKPILIFETASYSALGQQESWVKELMENFDNTNLAGIVWSSIHSGPEWELNCAGSFSHLRTIRAGRTYVQNWIESIAQ